MLLVTPSADFFSEPHVESLIGYAKVFHAAGIRWTLSSKASEAGNFGLFIGNYEQMRNISLRVKEAAQELGVKRIVVGECGHAWRVAYSFWNTLIGPFDWLDPRYPVPQHICEFTYDLIQRGALKFDKEKNDDRIITFHDSCNVARASRMGSMPGGQFVIPREIIKAVANRFHDMAPGTIHEATFCCGGGGGLLTDDLLELRVKGALPRMEALKQRRRAARREFHGHHLRHLQGAVQQGAAVLRLRHEHGRRRAPARQQGDPARRAALNPAKETHHGPHRHHGRRPRRHARGLRDARDAGQGAPGHGGQRARLLPVRAVQPLGGGRLAQARRGDPASWRRCSSARASASSPRR